MAEGLDIPLTISMIAAMSENRVIGRDQELPWNIPEDMKWFRDQTRGKSVIMGRKTYESIGRLLPKRPNIIITRNKDYDEVPGAQIVYSLDIALSHARGHTLTEGAPTEIMIIGGGEIYRQALPIANKIYLTVVHQEIEGDTTFPELGDEWTETESMPREGFTFKIYERRD